MTVGGTHYNDATLNILAWGIALHHCQSLLIAIGKLRQSAKEAAKNIIMVAGDVDKRDLFELLETEINKHAKQCAANIEPLAVPSVHVQLVPTSARNAIDVISMKEVARVDEYALFGISALFK